MHGLMFLLLSLSFLLSARYFMNVRSYGRTVVYRRLSFPSLLRTELARVEKEKEKEKRGERKRERKTSSCLPASLPPFSILVPRRVCIHTRATSSYRIIASLFHLRAARSFRPRLRGAASWSVLGTSPASSRSQSH